MHSCSLRCRTTTNCRTNRTGISVACIFILVLIPFRRTGIALFGTCLNTDEQLLLFISNAIITFHYYYYSCTYSCSRRWATTNYRTNRTGISIFIPAFLPFRRSGISFVGTCLNTDEHTLILILQRQYYLPLLLLFMQTVMFTSLFNSTHTHTHTHTHK